MIVVDTSVLIDFLRGRHNPHADRFRQLAREGTPYAIPVVCCQEVLQGARDVREWNLLVEYFAGQFIVDPTDVWATHLASARIYFDCRRHGLTVRSPIDCLIAQLVLEEEGILLHNDEDFERIANVRPLKLLVV